MRRVASAAGLDGLSEGQSGYLLDLVHDLSNGCALAGAHIEGIVAALVAVQVVQGSDMGVGQVGDVDVVTYAGAVRGGVVVPEDGRRLALPQPVEEHGDEIEDGRVLQADWSTAGHIEVAQGAEADAVRLLAGPVGVDGDHGLHVFGDHVDRRLAVCCGRAGEDQFLGIGLCHGRQYVDHAVQVLLVVPDGLLH